MVTEVLGRSPAGNIETIPNLKKRQRSVYYRPSVDEDGKMSWCPTAPLPSDAQGRELYLSKGFRLKPPSSDAGVAQIQSVVDLEKEGLLAENARLRSLLEAKQLEPKKVKHRRTKRSLGGSSQ